MAVHVRHITKSFPGVKALDDVSISIQPGQIHALVGANGSGKSTLVRIISGAYQPDQGEIDIGGVTRKAFQSPQEAASFGVSTVHQEAPLIDSLSVAECIALFHEYPTGMAGRIRWRELIESARHLLERLHVPVDPRTLTRDLTSAQRAMVALSIAFENIRSSGGLLILDEADAAIHEKEAEPYLHQVSQVAATDVPVLMVTHRISHVFSVADTVSVLAGGRLVHSGPTGGIDEETLVRKMLGDAPAGVPGDRGEHEAVALSRLWTGLDAVSPSGGVPGKVALVVKDLVARNINGLNLEVRPGEIVGVAGITGSGVTELPRVLAGMQDYRNGTISVGGVALDRPFTPRAAIRSGIVSVPADRLREGGIRSLSIRSNVTLPAATRYWRDRKRAVAVIDSVVDELDVRPPVPAMQFGNLSGGNQQKVVFGKWLALRPLVLVLDDPTQGVDPNSRKKLYEAMRQFAGAGGAILFFSTEPAQLAVMCSRVVVLQGGSERTELSQHDGTLSSESIGRWYYA